MGVPSPFLGPSTSPLHKLMHKSPELSGQAVRDLELELLPATPISCKVSGGPVRTACWADETDSVTSECGHEREIETLKTTSPPDSSQWGEAEQESQLSSISGYEQVPLWEVSEAFVAEAEEQCARCLPLWCRVEQDDKFGLRIEPFLHMKPFMDEDAAAECVAQGGSCEIFYCQVSYHYTGGTLITPCTDASMCEGADLEPLQAPSEAEASCAPPSPPEGSYAPVWVYGPRWPYNVAPTTLTISNLPEDFTQEDMIEILDKEGFSGFYDFVFLPPSDADAGKDSAFAIVNLTHHAYGLALAARLHGRPHCGGQVSWSLPLQGLTALEEHYSKHPANSDEVPSELRPTLFTGGFPKPLPRR
mmetsp:Transcript_22195/g.39093  ORF Transcript_22195/g.39093 Transcript_22195/m.39093 type:complete len:361 (+) Transcript_22195:227-1309(+)